MQRFIVSFAAIFVILCRSSIRSFISACVVTTTSLCRLSAPRYWRCRELLLLGIMVRLEVSDNRKTQAIKNTTLWRYTLRPSAGSIWDSQALSRCRGGFAKQGYGHIKLNYLWKSRIDFYMEKANRARWEVSYAHTEVTVVSVISGCTHRSGGEAPARVTQAQRDRMSVRCGLCIQMEGITEVIRSAFRTVVCAVKNSQSEHMIALHSIMRSSSGRTASLRRAPLPHSEHTFTSVRSLDFSRASVHLPINDLILRLI